MGSAENWRYTFVVVQSLSHVQVFVTPQAAAHQALLASTISPSLFKVICSESIMLSSHLILCCSLLLLPSFCPSITVFSSELALCIRWPKYWSFSFGPSNEYSGLISFRMEGRHRKWFNEGRSVLRRTTSTVKVQKYEKSQQNQGGQSRSTWLGLESRGWVGLTGFELEWKLESNPKGPCEPWPWSQWEELKGLSWSWGWGSHFRVLFWPCCGNQHRWECETRGTAAICSRGSGRNGHERWQWLVTGCGSENTEWSLDFWALGAWLGSCWWSIACGMKKMEARIRTPFLGKTNSIYWNGKQEKDEILEGR